MNALLEYAVFGQRIAVSEEDGTFVARLDLDPGDVWGKGTTPLAALGDCVLRWSTQEAARPDDADDEEPDGMHTFQSVQPRVTLPAAKAPARRKAPKRATEVAPPNTLPEERVVFGQRIRIARDGRTRFVAQLEGRGRMWWGHGQSSTEALADCILNWASPLIRIPDELEGAQAEFNVLGQLFHVLVAGESYAAHLVQAPSVQARGASPREALAGCIIRWGELQGAPVAPSW